jgi:hypothetical protein
MNRENQSSLAWFRLQEAFLKSEHERIFFSYRLLSHSISSVAFKMHILGDLHLVFNEIFAAINSYNIAFNEYFNENNYHGMFLIALRVIWHIEKDHPIIKKILSIINDNKIYNIYNEEIKSIFEIKHKVLSKKIKKCNLEEKELL